MSKKRFLDQELNQIYDIGDLDIKGLKRERKGKNGYPKTKRSYRNDDKRKRSL